MVEIYPHLGIEKVVISIQMFVGILNVPMDMFEAYMSLLLKGAALPSCKTLIHYLSAIMPILFYGGKAREFRRIRLLSAGKGSTCTFTIWY